MRHQLVTGGPWRVPFPTSIPNIRPDGAHGTLSMSENR
jgi:hypothetical protein